MNQFFQRVANYVGNEIIVKGLAESKTFQKFAVRTSSQYEEMSKHGAQHLNEAVDKMMNEAAESSENGTDSANSGGPPKPPMRGVGGFVVAFGKEVKKDFTVRENW